LDSNPGVGKLQGVEPVWIDVIARCLQPNPNDRFENAEQLLNSLESGLSFLPADSRTHRTNFGNAGKSEPGEMRRLYSIWKEIPWLIRVLVLSIAVLG